MKPTWAPPTLAVTFMAIDVKIPPMGESITGGLLAAWLAKDGDTVRKGQPLFKVTPDERVVEVDPAEERARLRRASEEIVAGLLAG